MRFMAICRRLRAPKDCKGQRHLGFLSGLGRASTTKRRICHPSRMIRFYRLFWAVLIGFPEVWPAFAGLPFGLGLAPGLDLAVVAGTQHLGDRPAFEYRRPGVLRVLQEPRGEAFLGAGSL